MALKRSPSKTPTQRVDAAWDEIEDLVSKAVDPFDLKRSDEVREVLGLLARIKTAVEAEIAALAAGAPAPATPTPVAGAPAPAPAVTPTGTTAPTPPPLPATRPARSGRGLSFSLGRRDATPATP